MSWPAPTRAAAAETDVTAPLEDNKRLPNAEAESAEPLSFSDVPPERAVTPALESRREFAPATPATPPYSEAVKAFARTLPATALSEIVPLEVEATKFWAA
jgi:hypothetical protein